MLALNCGVGVRPMIKVLTCAAALLLATIGFGAKAAPLIQTETSSVTLTVGSTTVSNPTSASLDGASGSVALNPFSSVQAQVNAGAGTNHNAVATLSYDFAVVGGNPGDQVPVLAATNLLATASPHSTASAELDLNGTQLIVVCTDGSCSSGSQFNGTVPLFSADPYIFVDPTFPNASDYSIIVSDGVVNVPPAAATPLPATLPLFASGLGAFGLLARRRKRVAN